MRRPHFLLSGFPCSEAGLWLDANAAGGPGPAESRKSGKHQGLLLVLGVLQPVQTKSLPRCLHLENLSSLPFS